MLRWLRTGSSLFGDTLSEESKFDLAQACLQFNLENLGKQLRKKWFQNGLPISQFQFYSLVDQPKGKKIHFKGLKLHEISCEGIELVKYQVTDCAFSELIEPNKWIKCEFEQCTFLSTLSKCKFIECVFKDCKFYEPDIEWESCSFIDCKMNEIDLSEKDLTRENFLNVKLNLCRLSNSSLGQLSSVKFVNCNFLNSIVAGVKDCSFEDCDFEETKILFESGVFTDCKMYEMDLSGQDLTQVKFINVDFIDSNLSKSKMGTVTLPILEHCNLDDSGLTPLTTTTFSMLNSPQNVKIVRQLPILISRKKVQLLYKASRDGFGTNTFRSKCDGKSPTITFIKSNHGYLFGGYTQAQWNNKKRNGSYASDWDAFIFTFQQGNELEVFKVKDCNHAIFNSQISMVSFGQGDIYLGERLFSTFGTSYDLPSGLTKGSPEANAYLAGSHEFNVTEIEVYQLYYDIPELK